MTVDFDCTERDIRELNHFFIKTPRGKREMVRIYFLQAIRFFFTAIGIATLLNYVLYGNFYPSFFGIALFGGIASFIANLFLRSYNQNIVTKQMIKRGNYVFNLGQSSVSITPEGVTHHGQYGKTVFFWSHISEVHETDKHFYLQASPVHFILIPKRAFANAALGTEFLRLTEQYRQQSTGEPIPQTTRGAWWTQGSSVVEPSQIHNRSNN